MNLILGQGLAGSVLAMRLLELGEEVCVVDNGHRSSSSMVAAGLWNPVVFRRINKSWLIDELLPELLHFYSSLEAKLGKQFCHDMPIWRKHSSQLEAELWLQKKNDPEYSAYLGEGYNHADQGLFGEFPFGQAKVNGAGFLDLSEFLAATRRFLIDQRAFRQMEIVLPDDATGLREWAPTGEKPKRIIDCRGYKSASSVWWRYLPFGLTKGEVITIHCPGLHLEAIFNAGFFVQPLGGDKYRIGATFDWDQKDEICTEQALQFLVQKFKRHIDQPFKVISQNAGVRPTVQDRRPLLGVHPLCDTLFLFNGLGTKGVMLAPYMARLFCNFLLANEALPPDVNLSRFEKFIGSQFPQVNFP